MENYEYSGLIVGGIVVVLLVRLAIGYWASKRVETTNDYVLAGRSLPIWMAAPSIISRSRKRHMSMARNDIR
jgi:Na+/proline symporter